MIVFIFAWLPLVSSDNGLLSIWVRWLAACLSNAGGPAIGELSGLLHFQGGGPTGPGADTEPVLAGVVRLSPLPSDDEGVGVIPESQAGEAGARFPGMDQCE